MKTFIYIIFLGLAVNSVQSQEYGSKSQFKVNGLISFKSTKSEIIGALGTPTRETKSYSEIDETDMIILWYGSSRLYLKHNQLASFEITDTSLYIQYDAYKFRVNDLLSAFQSVFPISYDKRDMNRDDPDFPPTMVINLKGIANSTEEVPIDEFINIKFNLSSLRITSISHRKF